MVIRHLVAERYTDSVPVRHQRRYLSTCLEQDGELVSAAEAGHTSFPLVAVAKHLALSGAARSVVCSCTGAVLVMNGH